MLVGSSDLSISAAWSRVLGYHVCAVVLCLLLITSHGSSARKPDIAAKCKTCTDIVNNIVEGIKKTEKSNFGGGNTNWEEKKLGSYAISETRLLEILEGACPDGKECHQMVEENEELLEKWWFKMYPKSKHLDLGTYFCINSLKVCCPNGTYGPECDECMGGKERPCKGNGKCRGDGTRTGLGNCDCDSGYGGDLCDTCTDNYYQHSQNDTDTVCKACDKSCKDKCSGPGPESCAECKDGWSMTNNGCQDVDECEDDPCEDDRYCSNTPGSHKCLACDVACSGCIGPTAANCDDCADRYYRQEDDKTCRACHVSCADSCTSGGPSGCDSCKVGWILGDDGRCQDIDECSAETSPCDGDAHCVNTQGSYKCSKKKKIKTKPKVKACHYSCDGCTGDGADKCVQCKAGYSENRDGMCQDYDECDEDDICPGQNTWCINMPGTYKCDCTAGYTLKDGVCIERAKDSQPKARTKRTSSSSEKPSDKKSSSKKKSKKEVEKNKQKDKKNKVKSKSKKSKKESSLPEIDESEYQQYWLSLVGFALIGFLLRSSVFAQTVFTAIFWIYLFWFSLRLDRVKKTL